MPDSLTATSLFLSIAIAAVALGLGLVQSLERAKRGEDLTEADRNHFKRQDLRRWLGVVLMLILALGVELGSRMEPRVADSRFDSEIVPILQVLAGSWIEPLVAGRANIAFVVTWLAMIALIMVLLAVALLDWLATRRYANRQRQAMARQRIEMLREMLGRADSTRKGLSSEAVRYGD